MRYLRNPLVLWSIWITVLVTVFILFMGSFFFTGLESDDSGISLVILLFFFVGVGFSLAEAIKLGKDHQHLNLLEQHGVNALGDLAGRIPELVRRVSLARSKQQTIEVSTVIDSFDTYHGATIRSLSVTSTILVTFGLIGTMIGLISSISGLNSLISNIGTSQAELMKGMQQTINGMGVAFYTTFFGAFFGGILLKILSTSLSGSLSKMAARLQSYLALEMAPDSPTDIAANLRDQIKEMSAAMKEFTGAMQQAEKTLSQLAQPLPGKNPDNN